MRAHTPVFGLAFRPLGSQRWFVLSRARESLISAQRFALLLMIAIGFLVQGTPRDVWECSMSGIRADPCGCSTHAEPAAAPVTAERHSCCEVHRVEDVMATADFESRRPHLPTPTAPFAVASPGARRLAEVRPTLGGRGPPGSSVPIFVQFQSLLL